MSNADKPLFEIFVDQEIMVIKLPNLSQASLLEICPFRMESKSYSINLFSFHLWLQINAFSNFGVRLFSLLP